MNWSILASVLLAIFGDVTWSVTVLPFKTSKGNITNPQLQINNDNIATLTCKCENLGIEWMEHLDRNVTSGLLSLLQKGNPIPLQFFNYTESIGTMLKNCNSCDILFARCDGNTDIKNDYQCKKVKRIPVTPYSSPKRLNKRFKRQTGYCFYPETLLTSELDCTHYHDRVKCIQRCAFGYTLKGGPEIEHNCLIAENKWDKNFRECKPFVDCTVTLVSKGSAKCTRPTLNEGSTCEINCTKTNFQKKTYIDATTCDIDGTWTPALPHCAVAGSGWALVDKDGNFTEEEYTSTKGYESKEVSKSDDLESKIDGYLQVGRDQKDELDYYDDSDEDVVSDEVKDGLPDIDIESKIDYHPESGGEQKDDDLDYYDDSEEDDLDENVRDEVKDGHQDIDIESNIDSYKESEDDEKDEDLEYNQYPKAAELDAVDDIKEAMKNVEFKDERDDNHQESNNQKVDDSDEYYDD